MTHTTHTGESLTPVVVVLLPVRRPVLPELSISNIPEVDFQHSVLITTSNALWMTRSRTAVACWICPEVALVDRKHTQRLMVYRSRQAALCIPVILPDVTVVKYGPSHTCLTKYCPRVDVIFTYQTVSPPNSRSI